MRTQRHFIERICAVGYLEVEEGDRRFSDKVRGGEYTLIMFPVVAKCAHLGE